MKHAPTDYLLFAQGGVWDPLINWLEIIVATAAVLAIIGGGLMIAIAPYDEEKRELGIEIIASAIVGLGIALLAVPIYNLIDGWTEDGQGSNASAPAVREQHVQDTELAAAPSLQTTELTTTDASEGA